MKLFESPQFKGRTFRTDGGTILLFMGGADKWVGPWPDMTWDTLYDTYVSKYIDISKAKSIPVIWIGPYVDYCREPIISGSHGEFNQLVMTGRIEEANKLLIKSRCENMTGYKHCSFECWYLSEKQSMTNDIRYLVHSGKSPSIPQKKLLIFEKTFKAIEDRWKKHRQQWST